ncbi:multicopper oxidase-domain-containing protein [Aspergillus candidus]|uniref:Multicopper oxidase-domain-containing protein n=1 Tax=Aspergillus candidus TaxID=41067 RepID=A0A2I2F0K0_ASPCN|nr:multicopper oxidase-domain-containing protein [Aspergillus candidus]PLB34160.1 multicopper oxidase-domain-containing protein [Aspergillus candidus]
MGPAQTNWLWQLLLVFSCYCAQAIADGPCENSPTSRRCWGKYNITTDYSVITPDTGVTREYWLAAQNLTLAPDGYERQVLVFNGSLPGPTIEADWGDTIVVHVTNQLTDNGTTVHWHGIRQQNSNPSDGVPGVTQCPIAPGDSMTYRFRAQQYGTAWYHGHFSMQMADGLYGPIVIHGPASADYDVDLGPVFVSDWYHQSAFITWRQKTMYGGFPVRTNANAENGLFNSTNNYPCDDSDDPACLGTGKRSETTVTKGRRYRMRLIDSSLDGWMRVSIDNHKLIVIAADLVPIVPYVTDNVVITSGQRYDIIFEADQDVGNYWMRTEYQSVCNMLDIDRNDIRGILHYEGAEPDVEPTSEKWPILPACGDEPYDKLVPYVAKDVDVADTQEDLGIGWFYEKDLVFHWAINTKPLTIDWGHPTDLLAAQHAVEYPEETNVYNISGNQWTYWVIQDVGFVDAFHPFHLHGHDFHILAQGRGLYNPITVKLNRKNPPRRDTATMAGSGYLVIAFETDNPGSWLMHCHIAWHTSQSLALQFVERESEIPALMDMEKFQDTCDKWERYAEGAAHEQDDSGI